MVAVRIYVEGGGNSSREQVPLRIGFGKLVEKILGNAPKPKFIPCGGRDQAFSEFKKGLRANPGDFCILLVDSETRVSEGATVWTHLKQRDSWEKPTAVDEDSAHLMVTCTEAWLLSDRAALKAYYGQGFKDGALPGEKNVERIEKDDLMRALEAATRQAKTKGVYRKTHAFDLIAMIKPESLRAASPWAAHFFDVLAKKLGAQGTIGRSR